MLMRLRHRLIFAVNAVISTLCFRISCIHSFLHIILQNYVYKFISFLSLQLRIYLALCYKNQWMVRYLDAKYKCLISVMHESAECIRKDIRIRVCVCFYLLKSKTISFSWYLSHSSMRYLNEKKLHLLRIRCYFFRKWYET